MVLGAIKPSIAILVKILASKRNKFGYKKALISKIKVDTNMIIKALESIFSLSNLRTSLALIFAQMTKPRAFAPKSMPNCCSLKSKNSVNTKLEPVI